MPNNQNKSLTDLAEIFKALSNPNRLEIFLRLATCCKPGTVGIMDRNDTSYVGELGQDLNIVKSTVSHHIKGLRQVGLIRTRREGQKIACWVDPEVINDLKDFFTFE
jgi:ArsR family transcriptional regulator, arsenate/arsenite/antimonite-responsive transcriptional repressor